MKYLCVFTPLFKGAILEFSRRIAVLRRKLKLPLTVFHIASFSQNCIQYWEKNIFVLKPVQNKHLCIRYTIGILFSLIIWVSQAHSFSPSTIAVVNTCFPHFLATALIWVLTECWRFRDGDQNWLQWLLTGNIFYFSKLVRVQHTLLSFQNLPTVPSLRDPDVQFVSYNAGSLKRFCC
jgi:hypothetical protein